MVVSHYYRQPGMPSGALARKLKELKTLSPLVESLTSELCYNVELVEPLSSTDNEKLLWILSSPLFPEGLQVNPHLQGKKMGSLLVEIGPRLNFSTAFSSNAVSMCHSVGLMQVTRLEVSVRYLIHWQMDGLKISHALENQLVGVLHDRMTECRYLEPITTFDHGIKPEPWFIVDVLGQGRKALEDVNSKLGLAFDDWDLELYTELFSQKLRRNPTSVECFDLAQSNSEHSRHWFFKGKMIINKKEMPESLLDMIIKTQETSNSNNVIKFSDNSSAIEGFTLDHLRPSEVDTASQYTTVRGKSHIVFTAETHNFPTGVAPFSGATTGTGGRIRDVQAVGKGGHCIAGTAGYCVGNLLIPGYRQPWEAASAVYPPNLASPLEILVEASNGASDYGNKFGEPVVCGFTRSFGLVDSAGERREWIKPIMFSGGLGSMDSLFVMKETPQKGMEVVKVGGPVYRIGVGGGAASSVQVQGDNQAELDFGAVQRGDPEMEQKLNRVIRACIESPFGNPIASLHDQGAGGNGNVLKELVEPSGAVIFSKRFVLGDPTISTLELWGAEYQENNALLCRPEHSALLRRIAHRERCPVCFVGTVTGTGRVILSEEDNPNPEHYLSGNHHSEDEKHPFNLDLELVLGKMPQKEFVMERQVTVLRSLCLPAGLTVLAALQRVLRMPSVCSKRFLTNKVDRCVTGLVAQQQCVGPLHTPLSDVAVTALSYFSNEGAATAIGEQPIKGLVNCEAGARMAVGESLSNLVFAHITDIQDVKCSGNWMWAAKLPGEGAALYSACQAMCQVMGELGVAVDGGKDSLSMAARVGSDTVKAPGTLVVSTYAPCPDVRQVITPDLKAPGASHLLLIDLSGRARLGGSALAQCFSQIGDSSPDMDDPLLFKRAFTCTQQLIKDGKLLSGHDISDGGLITCLLEMSFAGVTGLSVDIQHRARGADNPLHTLFAEELGWVLEVKREHTTCVQQLFQENNVPCLYLGNTGDYGMDAKILIHNDGDEVLEETVGTLMHIWEETSYQLERQQTNPDCARREYESLITRTGPQYKLTFEPKPSKPLSQGPRVAVLREEGSNGDREMAASLFMAGFQTWDVTMQDLLDKRISLDHFQGVVFPGGFSYADVLGSAKGWAASLLFNPDIKSQLEAFKKRADTFSLGVCNGCQLICLLGWVGLPGYSTALLPGADTGKPCLYVVPDNGKICQKDDVGKFEFPLRVTARISFVSFRTSMYRVRRRNIREIPPMLEALHEILAEPVNQYAQPLNNTQFYLGSISYPVGGTSLIFGSPTLIENLGVASEIHCDGTFKVCAQAPPSRELSTVMSVHFNKAMRRRAHSTRLTPLLCNNGQAKKAVLMCWALPLLPAASIQQGLDDIKEFINQYGVHGLQNFMNYIQNVWNEGCIKETEHAYAQMYGACLNGRPIIRARPQTYRNQDACITSASARLTAGELTVVEFLHVVSHLVGAAEFGHGDGEGVVVDVGEDLAPPPNPPFQPPPVMPEFNNERIEKPNVVLDHNISGRFECRWSTVRVETSNAIHLKGMAGSVLGVWVAHGEGRFTYREPRVLQELKKTNCVAITYVDDSSEPTETYPLNPNGSVGGVAGLCSADGRHLVLMPHPERSTILWQLPYTPPHWANLSASPWLQLFQNAYEWCLNNTSQ